jgi:hypothetical protein
VRRGAGRRTVAGRARGLIAAGGGGAGIDRRTDLFY